MNCGENFVKDIGIIPNLRTFVFTKIHLTTSATMIENETYHRNIKRIGKSGLELVEKSPFHYWTKYLDPNRVWDDDHTPAKLLGSAMHCELFEPEKFASRYVIPPKFNKRSNAGKAQFEAFSQQIESSGMQLLDAALYERCMRMAQSARKHPILSGLLKEQGLSEHVLEWDDPVTGVGCKLKADRITNSGLIIDAKSTDNASPTAFAKSVHKFGYHKQDAWYSDGFELATSFKCQGFIFAAIESSAPYVCKLYVLDEQSRQLGREVNRRNLDRYAECLFTDKWPAYGDDISELSLPGYAFKNY